MSKILGFIGSIIGLKALKIILYGFFISGAIAYYTFFVASVVQFYVLVHNFLVLLSNGGVSTGSILDKFFGLLTCIGFTDALISSLPMITSSLVFLFAKISWIGYNKIRKSIFSSALQVLS